MVWDVDIECASATGHPPIPAWALVVHRLALRVPDTGPASTATGIFPSTIPEFLPNLDPTGTIETYNTVGPTETATQPFFQSLGSNGRACVTCHEPRSAWSVSAASIQQRFDASEGTDPIFRPVDGATCPSADVSTLAAKRVAYNLLLSRGLIRIFLPLPAPRDFAITAISDPWMHGFFRQSADGLSLSATAAVRESMLPHRMPGQSNWLRATSQSCGTDGRRHFKARPSMRRSAMRRL